MKTLRHLATALLFVAVAVWIVDGPATAQATYCTPSNCDRVCERRDGQICTDYILTCYGGGGQQVCNCNYNCRYPRYAGGGGGCNPYPVPPTVPGCG